MSYPLGHTAAGLLLYRLFSPPGTPGWNWRDLAGVTVLANLPDLDIVAGLLAGNGNLFHRGPSHSLLFALALALLLPWRLSFSVASSYGRVFALCLLILLSHAALDGAVDREHLAFFWPWQPVRPHGQRGFAATFQEVAAVSQRDTIIATFSFLFLVSRSCWRNLLTAAGLVARR